MTIPFFKREQDKDIRQLGNREIAVNKLPYKNQILYKKFIKKFLRKLIGNYRTNN